LDLVRNFERIWPWTLVKVTAYNGLKHNAMKIYSEVEIYLHNFLPRHKIKMSCQLHAPPDLPLGKECRYPLDRRLSGPRGGLNAIEKTKMFLLLEIEFRTCRP
jgi:hypothetical protein